MLYIYLEKQISYLFSEIFNYLLKPEYNKYTKVYKAHFEKKGGIIGMYIAHIQCTDVSYKKTCRTKMF